MKKLICLCLVPAIAAIAIWAFSAKTTEHGFEKELSKVLGLNAKSAQILEEHDSHGGFHGDGLLFAALQFPDDTAKAQITAKSFWHPLPLSPTLTTLAYGSGSGTFRSGPYLSSEGGSPLMPYVENGWYFFFDRHSQSKTPYDETQVLDRHSFNFTLALYDADTDILYYTEFDT